MTTVRNYVHAPFINTRVWDDPNQFVSHFYTRQVCLSVMYFDQLKHVHHHVSRQRIERDVTLRRGECLSDIVRYLCAAFYCCCCFDHDCMSCVCVLRCAMISVDVQRIAYQRPQTQIPYTMPLDLVKVQPNISLAFMCFFASDCVCLERWREKKLCWRKRRTLVQLNSIRLSP